MNYAVGGMVENNRNRKEKESSSKHVPSGGKQKNGRQPRKDSKTRRIRRFCF